MTLRDPFRADAPQAHAGQTPAAHAARERALALRARRSRRLRTLAGALLTAAALAGVAISIAGRTPRHQTERRIDAEVSALLAGIPQHAATLGDARAPVTVTYFGDLECPVCADFTLSGGFPQLVSRDVRQGTVKVTYRSLCTATCTGPGPTVFDTQQVAAYAAGAQSLFWNYAELFYREQGSEGSGYVTESYLDRLATQVPGLNLDAWRTARGDRALSAEIRADGAAAGARGVSGTPTLIVTGPRGSRTVLASVPSYGDIERSIAQVS